MLRIVLPLTSVCAALRVDLVAVTAVNSITALNIAVAIEVVVVVNGNIVVAAPTGTPTITAAPRRSDHHAHAKRDRRACCVITDWGICDGRIRINRCTINDSRVVAGYVHDFRTRRLNHDNLFAFDDLRFDLLLLRTLEVPFLLRLGTHALNGIHHFALLSEECVAEICRPLDVFGELFDQVGKDGHGLDTGIPGLLHRSVGERLIFQVFVLCQPLLKLDDLQRIGGGDQHLAQQRVGVKRDRCYERVQLVGRKFSRLLLCCVGLLRGRPSEFARSKRETTQDSDKSSRNLLERGDL
jgi:hypothetical protein